jgi:hypothetical protein
MTFLLPIFLPIVATILAKHLAPRVLAILGFPKAGKLVLGDRVGPILFLVCSAVMAALAFWYPLYLSTYQSSPDDRYGYAALIALPFYFIGDWIAATALFRLTRALFRGRPTIGNGIVGFLGAILALIGFSPLLVIGWRLLSR